MSSKLQSGQQLNQQVAENLLNQHELDIDALQQSLPEHL